MPPTRINPDLEAYNQLHEEVLDQRLDFETDRRVAARKPFDWIQWLAPYDGEQVPTASQFDHVRCYDLSPQGFAYLATEPPEMPYVIIALGRVPFTFYVARVVSAADVTVDDRHRLKIGCQFLKRFE